MPESDDFVPVEVMPELIKKGKPEYPKIALRERKECTVYLRVLISENGYVNDVVIQKTDDPNWQWGFNEAVLEAAIHCRFKPAIQKGKPVKVWVSFPYEFILHR